MNKEPSKSYPYTTEKVAAPNMKRFLVSKFGLAKQWTGHYGEALLWVNDKQNTTLIIEINDLGQVKVEVGTLTNSSFSDFGEWDPYNYEHLEKIDRLFNHPISTKPVAEIAESSSEQSAQLIS